MVFRVPCHSTVPLHDKPAKSSGQVRRSVLILNGPVARRVDSEGHRREAGDRRQICDRVQLYHGAPAVRSWSKYREADKEIGLCATPLRKDSKSTSFHSTGELPPGLG
jgi:hypothetical protein